MTLDSIGVLRGENHSDRGLFGHYYDRSQRSGTLLFDEIEKAHPLIMDVFLQILSAARFTVATGETLDLSNYVVVATSNIGSRMLMESRSTDRETLVRRTIQAGTQEMRPETYARFDLHCVFNKLDYLTLNRNWSGSCGQVFGSHQGPRALDRVCSQGWSNMSSAKDTQSDSVLVRCRMPRCGFWVRSYAGEMSRTAGDQ